MTQLGEAFEGEDWREHTETIPDPPDIEITPVLTERDKAWLEALHSNTLTPEEQVSIGLASDNLWDGYTMLYPSERTPERLRAAYEHAAQAAALLRPWAGPDEAEP